MDDQEFFVTASALEHLYVKHDTASLVVMAERDMKKLVEDVEQALEDLAAGKRVTVIWPLVTLVKKVDVRR